MSICYMLSHPDPSPIHIDFECDVLSDPKILVLPSATLVDFVFDRLKTRHRTDLRDTLADVPVVHWTGTTNSRNTS